MQTLKDRLEKQFNLKFILFFDEFTPRTPRIFQKLALLRRLSEDCQFRVITASTNKTAANLHRKEAQSIYSRNGPDKHWITILRKLPRFELDTNSRISNIDSTKINLWRLNHIWTISRPLFAGEFLSILLGKLKEFENICILLNLRFPLEDADIIDIFRDYRLDQRGLKRGLLTTSGVQGYILAMLTPGFKYVGMSPEKLKKYSALSTHNWAYLANDPVSITSISEDPMQLEQVSDNDSENIIQLKRGDIPLTNSYHESSARTEWTEPEEYMKSFTSSSGMLEGLKGHELPGLEEQFAEDNLYRDFDGQKHIWNPTTYFPRADREFLLHLFTAGSISHPGLFLNLKKVACAYFMEKFDADMDFITYQNQNNFQRDGTKWEGICCACFFLACNGGSVRGSKLSNVLSRLVSELNPQKEYQSFEIREKEGTSLSKWLNKRIPFISPFNSPWPTEVDQLTGTYFANATRVGNSEQVDGFIKVYDGFQIQLEMKIPGDSQGIKKSLERIHFESTLAFIICKDSLMNPTRTLDNWHKNSLLYHRIDVDSDYRVNLTGAALFRCEVDHVLNQITFVQFGPEPASGNMIQLIIVLSQADLYRKKV